MSSIPLKRCSKCGVEYLATPDFFNRDKSKPDGLRPDCKVCSRAYGRIYAKAHPEIRRNSDRRWYAENAEHVLETSRQWRKRNHESYCESVRRRYAKNPEPWRENNRRWYSNNPEKSRIKSSQKRARKRGLPATFTTAEWERCLEYWQGCCCVCGRPPGLWHTLAQEHWIAIGDSRENNPGTVATNIIPVCHSKKGIPAGMPCCNNSKWKHDPIEWLARKFGKRKAKQIATRIEAYFEWVRKQDKT